MLSLLFKLLVAASAAATLVACRSEADPSEPYEDQPTPSRFVPSILPGRVPAGDCDGAPPVPSVCEWANSVDAVVVGDIDRVEPILAPLLVRVGDQQPYLQATSECMDGFVSIGIVIHVNVQETLYGDADSTVAVHVGDEGMAEWGARAYLENSQLQWRTPATQAPFAVGTTVGLAITRPEGEPSKWSLMAEMPFTFAADGTTVFEKDICGFAPPSPPPNDFWTLQSELAGCPRVKNTRYEGRQTMHRENGPSWTYASSCHKRDPAP